jgi:hypothetical protein
MHTGSFHDTIAFAAAPFRQKNVHPEKISAPYCLVAAIQSFVVKG